MKRFTQISGYPYGDCLRTCFASIMESEKLEDVPNFMRDGEDSFDNHLKSWLNENEMLFLTIDMENVCLSTMVDNQLVVITGKKKADGVYHSVVGVVEHNKENNVHNFYVVHDPLGIDCDKSMQSFESILQVGFLTKTFNNNL